MPDHHVRRDVYYAQLERTGKSGGILDDIGLEPHGKRIDVRNEKLNVDGFVIARQQVGNRERTIDRRDALNKRKLDVGPIIGIRRRRAWK
ncbi:hypothetical protein [Paraeggerthella sp.]|uniref:hypothetical protein n=1 Tax=Paraeggerthella sp. TaxID=2897350 RepID=UPI00352963D9